MPDALENWQAGLCLSFLYRTKIRDFKTGCRPSTLLLRVATDVLRTEMYSKSSHLQSLTPRSIKASTSYLNAYMATQLSAECSAWAVRAWPLGSFRKTSVLTVVTHIVLPRSTETQLAAWTSGVLGISANSVTSCYRLIHECVQPFSTLSYLWPAALPRGKLQALNHGACDLKDGRKSLRPVPSSPAAGVQGPVHSRVPSLQVVWGSRNAGYREAGTFWGGWTVNCI